MRFKHFLTEEKENSNDKKKIVPVVLTPAQEKNRLDKKINGVKTLSKNIRSLKVCACRDIGSENEKKRLTAAVISIMVKTAERVGNQTSENNGHVGITGLQAKHISFADGKATLSYIGKSGVSHEKVISDSKLVDILKQYTKGKKDSENIFVTKDGIKIQNRHVNNYLEEFGISAKDIRGYSANEWMIKELSNKSIPSNETERKKIFLEVLKKVADKVGHGAATLRKHYLLPQLEDGFMKSGTIIDLKSFHSY